MYRVEGTAVRYKGAFYKTGETIDAPAESMQELLDTGYVSLVEVPDAQTATEPASDVEQAPVASAKEQAVEAAAEAAPDSVKKASAPRKRRAKKVEEE